MALVKLCFKLKPNASSLVPFDRIVREAFQEDSTNALSWIQENIEAIGPSCLGSNWEEVWVQVDSDDQEDEIIEDAMRQAVFNNNHYMIVWLQEVIDAVVQVTTYALKFGKPENVSDFYDMFLDAGAAATLRKEDNMITVSFNRDDSMCRKLVARCRGAGAAIHLVP
jgi:hypothetical protein